MTFGDHHQLLDGRLARLETLIAPSSSHAPSTTSGSGADLFSALLQGSTPPPITTAPPTASTPIGRFKSLWGRVNQATAKLATVMDRLGGPDGAVLQYLEKEIWSSKDMVPQKAQGSELEVQGKQAILLSREEEIRDIARNLKMVGELRDNIKPPFLEELSDLGKALDRIDAKYVDNERRVCVLSHRLDQLLTLYDDMVDLLSRKCVVWDETLAALEEESGLRPTPPIGD